MNKAEQSRAEEAGDWSAAVVESSDDAIVGTTLDGVITSWNPGAQRLYSYFAQEALGRSISTLFPPDHPEKIPRILGRIKRRERLDRYETAHACKNGWQLEVSVTV